MCRHFGDGTEDCECTVKAAAYSYDKKHGQEKEPIVRYCACSINTEDEGTAETACTALREHCHIGDSLHRRPDIDFGQA